MIPQRNVLLVTGAEDEAGMVKMAEIAEEELKGNRPLTGVTFRLRGTTWEPYQPAPGHAAYEKLKTLYLETVCGEYDQQRQLLERLYAEDENAPFIASVITHQNTKTGEHKSVTVWGDGVDGLWPRTDGVVFMAEWLKRDVAKEVGWEQVMTSLSDLVEPTGYYPPRIRVRRFPSRERLAALGLGE